MPRPVSDDQERDHYRAGVQAQVEGAGIESYQLDPTLEGHAARLSWRAGWLDSEREACREAFLLRVAEKRARMRRRSEDR